MSLDQIIAEGKHLRLLKRDGWEFAQRKNISGIVGIVAVTDERKLVLVEQMRIAIGRTVIEIPAGLVGDTPGVEHEDMAGAANRELEEETGYRATRMEFLASGASSAGMTDEMITIFRARGLVRRGPGGGDSSENIQVHEVPLGHVPQWLMQRMVQGVVVDLKVYSALFFALQA